MKANVYAAKRNEYKREIGKSSKNINKINKKQEYMCEEPKFCFIGVLLLLDGPIIVTTMYYYILLLLCAKLCTNSIV